MANPPGDPIICSLPDYIGLPGPNGPPGGFGKRVFKFIHYEGLPILSADGLEFLPRGALFPDPRHGNILLRNSEPFLIAARGMEPGFLDPVDFIAGRLVSKGAIRSFFGKSFSTNLNTDRILQPYDSITGRFLPYNANLGFKSSPFTFLSAGLAQDFGAGISGDELPLQDQGCNE